MSLSSAVHRIFPVPNYLRLPSIGVDISDTSLKYIQFLPNYQKQQLNLTTWGDIDIPSGTLAGGQILEPKILTDVLREMKAATNATHVRVSLPEERAYLFETEIKKGTSFKEIRGVLEFRLEENVPLSPRDAYFDYEIIPHSYKRDTLRVSVTAYARETIDTYYEAVQAANLQPLSFEVEAAAIARASLPPGEVGTHLIIDFGKTRTGVGIMHQGTLMYTSTIDMGGNELSKAMRAELGDVAESELTRIKNTVGLTDSAEYPKMSSLLASEMDKIIAELSLRIQYWNNRPRGSDEADIASIILCGGSTNLKGLPAYIESKVGIPSSRAAVWQNAFDLNDTVPPIDLRHSYGYATAVGLALAGHIAFYD